MTRIIKIPIHLILFIGISMVSWNVFAQNPVCVYCGTSLPNGVHIPPCKYAIVNSASTAASGSSENLNNVVAGAIFQSVLNSILNNNSEKKKKELDEKQRTEALAIQQAAEQQRINAAIAQAEYDNMMRSYKLLENSQNVQIKSINSTNVDFKTLNGDAETLTTNARKQFENTLVVPVSALPESGGATPFFGDTMPVEDIQTLLNPENDPRIVDLRGATKYIAENIVKDSTAILSLLRKYETEGNGEPINQKNDCKNLRIQLNGFTNQRQQFQKTVDLSQKELDIWESANRNALINAAKDGLEYFTGQWLEKLTNRGKAAERLQRIYDKNVSQMSKDGIDIALLQSKIEKLRSLSSAGKINDLANSMNDWQTFIKDGMSSLISRLTDSNTEIKSLLEDPKLKEYFETEKPELNSLLDISKLAASNLVFGKWVAKKIPLIACIEISIKQLYNGTDYFLSLNRIFEAKKINGTILETARGIQKNIDNAYMALSQCN